VRITHTPHMQSVCRKNEMKMSVEILMRSIKQPKCWREDRVAKDWLRGWTLLLIVISSYICCSNSPAANKLQAHEPTAAKARIKCQVDDVSDVAT